MLFSVTVFSSLAVAMNGITLQNAANPGVKMPLCGLGTGGYGNGVYQKLGVYPECWTDMHPDASGSIPHPGVDCSAEVKNATLTWLQIGGRRIDNGDSYEDMHSVGDAVLASGIKRYIDLLLIHWPTSGKNSSEPKCQPKGDEYDATECRLITWKALVKNWKAGKAKAIGVSNFNMEHLQEIIDAKLPLPAVNQIPVNPHLYAPQKELIAMCNKHNIVVNSYSPLGIPDWKLRIDPIAKKHGLTNAQVLLSWQVQMGMVYNPRPVASTKLDAEDVAALNSFEPDDCKNDSWYECCGGSQPSIPSCGIKEE
eukprot:gene2069-18842_t